MMNVVLGGREVFSRLMRSGEINMICGYGVL